MVAAALLSTTVDVHAQDAGTGSSRIEELTELWVDGELEPAERIELIETIGEALVTGAPEEDADALVELGLLVADDPGVINQRSRFLYSVAHAQRTRGDEPAAIATLAELRDDTLRIGGSPPYRLRVFGRGELDWVHHLRNARRWREALDRIGEALEWAARELPAASDRISDAERARYEVNLLVERAAISLAWGLRDQAAATVQELIGRAEQLPADADDTRMRVGFARAEVHLARGEPDRTVSLIEAELTNEAVYPARRPARARMLVRAGLARASQARRSPERRREAQDYFERALAEPSIDPLERPMAWIGLADLRFMEGDHDRAREWLDLVDEQAATLDARRAGLAAVLRSKLARTDAEPLGPRFDILRSVFDRFLQEWRRVPLRPGGLGYFLFQSDRQLVSELVELQLAVDPDAGGQQRAFETLLEAQALNSLPRRLGRDVPVSLAELRERLLAPGHGLLVWAPGPDQSRVFFVDRTTLASERIPVTSELRAIVEQLESFRARTPGEGAGSIQNSSLEGARAAFLPPSIAARLATCSHLNVVGDGSIGELPLEELSRVALGDEVTWSVWPSVGAAMALLDRRAARTTRPRPRIACVAQPDPAASLERDFGPLPTLPFGAREASELGAGFAESGWLQVDGATRASSLLAPEVGESEALVLVAHAVQDYALERPTQLVLGSTSEPESLVGAGFVERTSPPGLVAINACAAERGPVRRGDGAAGNLAGAFLFAGADCVVLSPDRVEYHAGLKWTKGFLDAVGAGATPAQAAQEARRVFARSGSVSDYAPRMRVIGLGHLPTNPDAIANWEPSDPPPTGLGLRTLGFALAALVAFVFAVRRARS